MGVLFSKIIRCLYRGLDQKKIEKEIVTVSFLVFYIEGNIGKGHNVVESKE